jgi:energy-coupling factor transporter ATP-binding protein EcfA2
VLSRSGVDGIRFVADMTTTLPNNLTAEALVRGRAERLTWLIGTNFSGRSAILQKACAHHANSPGSAISVPPELHGAISGLAPNVREEILLHAGRTPQEPIARRLAQEWGLASLEERDPFTLSGGEQGMLVLLCKLALGPRLLALDGTLEQLDPDNLRRILSVLGPGSPFSDAPAVLLTHNGHIPRDGPEIQQLPAAAFTDIQRIAPPPPLDPTGFEPPTVLEPVSVLLNGIAFRYPRGATVFKDLTLRLEPGHIYRLAGPNGSGKSTLARLLTGVLRYSRGEILANGRRFDSYSRPGTLARLHFQSPNSQLFESTVRDELHSLPTQAANAAARFAGLEGFLNHHPFDLPFVLRKRLALTLILHTSAPWLIFDEPTLGQDEHSLATIRTALRKLAKAGHGIIIISHNSEFAKATSDQELNLPTLSHG